jgi:predicted CXXCH cytochrome family protein
MKSSRRSLKRRTATWLAALAISAVGLVFVWLATRPWMGPPRRIVPGTGPDNEPATHGVQRETSSQQVARPDPPPSGFVGSSTCAECHPKIAARFRNHPMGRSAAAIAEAAEIEDYARKTTFSAKSGLSYRVEKRGGRVFHHESARDNQGELFHQSAEIRYVIGSGVRGRSYLLQRDDMLFVSPIGWYSQKHQWGLQPGYESSGNMHFERRALDMCLRCHVGRVHSHDSARDKVGSPAFHEISIGCENCHGPGEGHVRFRRSKPALQADPIVNPSRLAPKLRDSVCHQCHLSQTHAVLRYGRKPYDFRPGMHLTDLVAVFVKAPGSTTAQSPESITAISQSEQLASSRCFQKSNGRLGCISCHDPHSVPERAQRVEFYRNRCARCHGKSDPKCRMPLDKRTAAPETNSCIGCHMPRFDAADIPHTTQTDHRILRFAKARVDGPGKSKSGPASPVFDDLAVFEGEQLSEWARRRARNVLLAKVAFDNRAEAAARAARQNLQETLKSAPDDLDVLHALALCALVLDRPDDAVRYWKRILAVNPRHEQTLMWLARQLAGARRWQASLRYFDRFLEVNRWFADMHLGRSRVLLQLDRPQEALTAALEGTRLNPSVSDLHDWLAEVLRKNGKITRSLQSRDKAARLRRIVIRRFR